MSDADKASNMPTDPTGDSIAVSIQIGGDPSDPSSGRRIALPSIPRALPVIQATSMRDVAVAVAESRSCGNCRWFNKEGRSQLAVTKMFTALWNDAKWNENWHDPNDFGYCAGAAKRTAVESTAPACPSWEGRGAIRSFFGQRGTK